MSEALRNLIEMKPQNLIPEVYIALLVIWLMVLVATLWSILKTRMGGALKVFWALVVIALPLVGVLAYALFSITKLDFQLLTLRAKAAKVAAKERKRGKGVPPVASIIA